MTRPDKSQAQRDAEQVERWRRLEDTNMRTAARADAEADHKAALGNLVAADYERVQAWHYRKEAWEFWFRCEQLRWQREREELQRSLCSDRQPEAIAQCRAGRAAKAAARAQAIHVARPPSPVQGALELGWAP